MYLIESIENHHIIKEYNFVFQMQWRMREERGQVGRWGKRRGRQTREDGLADQGRGWGMREEDRQVDEGRQAGEEDGDSVGGSGNIYLNKSWT